MPRNDKPKVSSRELDRRGRSPTRRTRSPSPTRKNTRPTSPVRQSTRPTSPVRKDTRPSSLVAKNKRPTSPGRKRDRSSQQTRADERRSLSPVRNGISALTKEHTLERFAKVNFIKPSKRPKGITKASGHTSGEIWQHTTEPITRPLLVHLATDQQLSTKACAAFKAIMKYMGEFPTKKSNLQGNQMTDKIFKDVLKYDELKDEIYCQIIKQLTDNNLNGSESRGWELMWLATSIVTCSTVLKPELTKFLRAAHNKLAQDCLHRLHDVLQNTRKRKFPPHWVEVETIQHNFTEIFHFVFLPDDKSNASFQVSSSMTVGDLCSSIRRQLDLASEKGFGLFIIMANKIVALDDENDFFFDALRYRIDWEQEGIKSTQSEDSDMPVLAYQMFFLRKIWTDVIPGADPQSDTILHYPQELPKFLRGYHKCSREDAVKLAALQFRASYGNDQTEMQDISTRLNKFLPEKLVQSRSPEDWMRAIVSAYNHSSMTNMTKDGAKIAFLKIVYKWPTFGSSFFEAAKVTRSDTDENVLLAINKRGLMIIDKHTKDILKTYTYSEIQGWAGSETNDFFLTVGNDSTRVMKLHFKTNLGYKMDDLLTSYVRFMKRESSSASPIKNPAHTKHL